MSVLSPVPPVPIRDDPTQDATWKRWFNQLQSNMGGLGGFASGAVLFADAGGNPTSDTAFSFNSSTNVLTVNGSTFGTNTQIGGTLGVTGNTTLTGDLSVQGNTTIGNAGADTTTFNSAAWTLANATTVTGTWANLGTVTTIDINGGTIDGTTQASGTINGSLAVGGTWTAAATWTLPALTLGGTVSGGGQQLNNIIIGTVTPLSGSFTTGTFSSTVTLSGTAANIALGSNFISNGGTDAGLSLDSSNNATFSADLTITDQLIVSGTGPHAMGGAISANCQFRVLGSFTGSTFTAGFQLESTLTGVAGNVIYGWNFTPTFVEASSGTHALIAGIAVNLNPITAGTATTTNVAGINIGAFTAASGTGTASAIRIGGPPTGATNNYAINVISGESIFGGQITLNGTAANISLGSNYLSGDGGDEGISVNSSGNVTCSGTLGVTSSASILTATAIPAGGTAGSGYKFSSTSNFGIFFGSGAPSLSAAKGSLYLRSDGSTTNDRAYINTDGGTTWTALTTVA